MADFLLELLSEEIPARMQARARNELARLFAECAGEAGLDDRPDRRLFDAAAAGADRARRRRGDRGEPRRNEGPAHLGAAAGARGLPAQDRAYARTSSRNATASISRLSSGRGRAAAEILGEAVKRHRRRFPWPKSMRWGDGDLRWVRPLHGIVAMLGEEIVPVEIDGIARARRPSATVSTIPGPITIGGAQIMSRSCAPAMSSSTRTSASGSSATARRPRRRGRAVAARRRGAGGRECRPDRMAGAAARRVRPGFPRRARAK